jgi:hypothetical protein
MYYPKSKIITDLYTNGQELVYVATEQPYTGAYHILSNGKIYTGKNPQDGELQSLKFSEAALLVNDTADFSSVKTSDLTSNTVYDYIRRRQQITPPKLELLEPKYTQPIPNTYPVLPEKNEQCNLYGGFSTGL